MKTRKINQCKEDSENSGNSNKNDEKKSKSKVKDKKDNIELDLVEEKCRRCGKRMLNVKYIWVGIEDDKYYCQTCVNKYRLEAVLCDDLE